jgi:hypothetical protein
MTYSCFSSRMFIEAQNTATICQIRRDSRMYSCFSSQTLRWFVEFVVILQRIPIFRHGCASMDIEAQAITMIC